ncbi:THAP domain-containing protein 7-like [Anguilla anguilla]|uniref:THAP domain-containing protein 7-like n=1 Tax=Anguilla anguilla TaxID=7936 RepID=UPI0015AC42C2|nr:THAP domain-containing protein 7-like [Anguilla anguilla]
MPVCSAFKCNARTGCNKDNSKLTFHRFPLKQPERLKIWIRVTQKDHWIPTPNSVLCSRHFKEDCFDRTGQTTRIRADAVPTIVLFPRKKSQLLEMQESEQNEVQNSPRRKRGRPRKAAPKTEQASKKDPPSIPNKSNNAPLPAPVPVPVPSKNNTASAPSAAPPAPQVGRSAAAAASRPLMAAAAVEHQPSVLTYFSYVPRVEPKPLLPSDHLYAVTESPVRLKRRCNNITDKLEACRKKLKMEQQKVRRWHRDVAKLKTAVKELRKESAAPPSCSDMVAEKFSGVPKELVKRMLGEKRASLEYTEELKAFAFKLRLLSPKAYNYVRSSFKQALPHPSVMRTWQAHGKLGGVADGDDALPEALAEEDAHGKKGAAVPHARTAIQQCQYARLRVKAQEGDSFAEWVEIHKGMVVYICFFKGATEKVIPKMVKALLNVKLFEAGPGKQASVLELPGSVLVVPQDTLGGQAKRRSMHYPNNIESTKGLQLYASFVTQLESQLASSSKCTEAGVVVRYGVYGEKQALVMDSDGLSTHLMEF